MSRLGVLGATALSLSFAVATPVLAQQAHGGRAAAGAHAMSGNMGGGQRVGAQANFAARGNAQFNRGNPQFAEGDRGVLGGGQFRGGDARGFRRGADFAAGAAAAGIVTGAAIAAGSYGYGGYGPYDYGDSYAYDTGYYGDSYAYDAGVSYDTGLPLVTFDQPAPVVGPVAVADDASYCAQRYRSYDPASGTYLGFDGLRHPCQ